MPCYHPIPAARGAEGMEIHPKDRNGYTREPTHWLPCGKCLGCREIKQQELAIRFSHTARYYKDKYFLTLTYNEENCPDGLEKNDLKKFWKRLRRKTSATIKYLACGEYGDRTNRPHYHAAVVGLELNDLKRWDSENHNSPYLDRIWSNGIVTVSELTEGRIKYVAGYVLKKAGYRRQIYCTEDGVELQEPYRDMSHGLGKQWIEQFQGDLRHGYLKHEGAKNAIPRYYMDKITDEKLRQQIAESKAQKDQRLTGEDRKCLQNGEKIRQQQIRERQRDRV